MALLLLKMNNLSAAQAVLSKANRFNSDVTNKITANLHLEITVKERSKELDSELAVKNDQSQLIRHQDPETKLKGAFKRQSQYRYEDASVMEAKYSFFFISGLYE